jgi:hypothetical protein
MQSTENSQFPIPRMGKIRELGDRTNFLEQNYFEGSGIGQISWSRVMENEFLKLGCSAKARGKLGEQMNDLLDRSNPSKNTSKICNEDLGNICNGEREDVIGGGIQMIRNNCQQETSVVTVKGLFSVMGGAGMLAGISKGDP